MISNRKINLFEKIICYTFKNKKLLIHALVHPSFLKDNKTKKNILYQEFERLEFLGDRVLGLSIASLIYSRFNNL